MDFTDTFRLLLLAKWLLLITVYIATLSCAPDEICFTDNTTTVQIKFLETFFEGTDSVLFEDDTLIFNHVTALGTDSVFVSSDTLIAITIPVNTGTDVTTFIFDTDQGLDTLELSYERFQRLISETCGPEQIVDSLKMVRTSFDSVAVVSTLLNQNILSNVEVYR